jgi:hypothetical protein
MKGYWHLLCRISSRGVLDHRETCLLAINMCISKRTNARKIKKEPEVVVRQVKAHLDVVIVAWVALNGIKRRGIRLHSCKSLLSRVPRKVDPGGIPSGRPNRVKEHERKL